jgi:Xaa-Pro dipeptidase
MDCEFPPEELGNRMVRLRAAMERQRLEGLVLTGPENIFRATGRQMPRHFAFRAFFVPLDRDPFLIVPQREEMNAQANTHLADIRTYTDDEAPADVLAAAVNGLDWQARRIGAEMKGPGLVPTVFARLTALVPELRDASPMIGALRAVKSALELSFIDEAARYADVGLEAGIAAVRVDATENTVAAAMMQAAVAAGSEYVGMQPLVSSGPRSGVPHATRRRRRLAPGDALFLELAGCHNRYHSAILRPVWLGPMPDEARRMLDAAQAGLAPALDALRPGATCAAVHQAAETTVARRGFAAEYRKRTGYSMGVAFAPDWGEGDVLTPYRGVEQPLELGMVFHIPITLRAYGRFTTGVSETAVVTENGHRCLSRIPRRLFEVS